MERGLWDCAEGGEGLSQDAVPGVEVGAARSKLEMLTATCLHSTWVAASIHKVSRTITSAEPSTEGFQPRRGAAAAGSALLRKLLLILLKQGFGTPC